MFRSVFLLSVTLVAFLSVGVHALTAPYNFCATYTAACNDLLTKVNCPAGLGVNQACLGSTIDTFVGKCTCGAYDLGSVRIAEDLIDYSVKSSVASLLSRVTAESNRLDVCGSYTNVCNAFFQVVSCPAAAQSNFACNNQAQSDIAISAFNGTCNCGTFPFANNRVTELVQDIALSSAGYIAGAIAHNKLSPTTVNYCAAYEELCGQLLNNTLHCPAVDQRISSCTFGDDLISFNPICECNTWVVATGRLQENLVDTILTASNPSLFVRPDGEHFTASAAAIDLCASQHNICQRLFANLSCPLSYQQRACQINGVPEYSATCTCGGLNVADGRIMEEIVDALVNADIPGFATASTLTTTTTTTTPAPKATTSPNAVASTASSVHTLSFASVALVSAIVTVLSKFM